MTQVNLLPQEVQASRRTRRQTTMVVSAVGGVLGLLIVIFILQSARLAAASHQLDEQRAVNGQLETQIGRLTEFEQLKQSVTTKQDLLSNLLQGEILWSGVLRDVSVVIPTDMWLTSMSGSMQVNTTTTPGVVPTTTSSEGLVGNIQFQGIAFHHTTVAEWLDHLARVKGWLNPWISTSSKQGNQTQVSFTSSVDLGVDATTGRQ